MLFTPMIILKRDARVIKFRSQHVIQSRFKKVQRINHLKFVSESGQDRVFATSERSRNKQWRAQSTKSQTHQQHHDEQHQLQPLMHNPKTAVMTGSGNAAFVARVLCVTCPPMSSLLLLAWAGVLTSII